MKTTKLILTDLVLLATLLAFETLIANSSFWRSLHIILQAELVYGFLVVLVYANIRHVTSKNFETYYTDGRKIGGYKEYLFLLSPFVLSTVWWIGSSTLLSANTWTLVITTGSLVIYAIPRLVHRLGHLQNTGREDCTGAH